MKKLLYFLILVLIVVVGVGITLTGNMQHDGNQHAGFSLASLFGQHNMENAQDNMDMSKKTDEKTTIVLEPDLRRYIDDVNRGIHLINEANGLITADPFFANPPRVNEEVYGTPFDVASNNQVMLYPNGTYRVVGENRVDMTNIHRGIYKLGQGMTLLNSALDRMNTDIRNNNFPLWTPQPNITYPNYNLNQSMTNTQTSTGGHSMANMSGMADATGAITHNMSAFNTGTISYILTFAVVGFLIVAVVSLLGFISSIFRKPLAEK